MKIKKLSRKEVVESYNPRNRNRFSVLENYDGHFAPNAAQRNPSRKNNDLEVNSILTPRMYSNVLKRPRPSPKVAPVQNYNPQDHAWVGAMGGKVFEKPNVNKVSLLEKTMTEFITFMKDYFNKERNMHDLNAVLYFGDRLNKIYRDLDCDIITNATMDNPYNENTPI
ncbi:hypothetical protein CVS40_5807 [Lucilia cuprina]|nr:hypothetical protein CVS40_5807 [Lucilia cuprina]